MGPLARRAPGRLARGGVWGVLVAGAFLLLSTAAAAAPLYAEASGNAALLARLAVVPPGAAANQAPVVRVVGGEGTSGLDPSRGGIKGIPGLGPGSATATSVGREALPKDVLFTPFVAVGDRPIERARIYGDDDLVHSLAPAPGSPAPSTPGNPIDGTAAEPGVWLPAPLATALQVSVGDAIEVGVQQRRKTARAPARVAGIYRVGRDGRSPADPAGSLRWTYRQGELPPDTEFATLPAYLLVTDVTGAGLLAQGIGDDLLYAVEGRLDPARPTLAQATATVAGIRKGQVEIRDPDSQAEIRAALLRPEVLSGLPSMVDDATRVADRSVAWTSTVGRAGLVLGLLAVLAVAVFGLARRAVELRHAAGSGLHPGVVGALAAVEVLAVALVCAAAGLGLAWWLVSAVGPPGVLTGTGLRAAATHALLAAGAGVLVVGGAAVPAAVRAGRLAGGDRRPRSVPWEPVLLAIAVTASAGLFARPLTGGPPSALDLLVPVLVLAAAGAVGSRLLLRLAAVASARSAARNSARGAARSGAGGKVVSGWSRRPALTLAGRRLRAGGQPAVLLITVLALGFGFLIYAFAAASAIREVTADRAAVRAGAMATAGVEASWLLDPGAATLPEPDEEQAPDAATAPVPGTRTPPLPAGVTVVWRGRVTVPPEYAILDLMVVDPARFAQVASWGTGPELSRARKELDPLAGADARALVQIQAGHHATPVPAIGVGAVLEGPGDKAAIATTFSGDVPITVLDVVPAFPGVNGNLPVFVVPADSFFSALGPADPRVAPPAGTSRFDRPPSEFAPYLWSDADLPALQDFIETKGVKTGLTTQAAEIERAPDLVAARGSTGYLIALGLCVGGLAVLGLALFAERSATRARAADLMLTRLGLGRAGVTRARAIELAALVLIALLLAGVGIGVIVPLGARLLDPGGGRAPAFHLRPDALGLLVALLAVGIGLVLALAVSRSRTPAGSEAEVLRDVE